MQVTRRQFGAFLGLASAALSSPLAAKDRASDRVLERRVYDPEGAIPPHRALRRCGILHYERADSETQIAFLFSFPSLAERTRAWDRFNSDPEWREMRARGDVRLRQVSFLS